MCGLYGVSLWGVWVVYGVCLGGMCHVSVWFVLFVSEWFVVWVWRVRSLYIGGLCCVSGWFVVYQDGLCCVYW